MLKAVALLVISLVSSVTIIESARILAVFPTPSISHQVVFRPLTQELVKRGHEVIVLTPDPVFPKGKAPKNLTEIDVHDMSYNYWRENFLAHATGKKNGLYVQVKVLFDIMAKLVAMQFETAEFKKIIDEKQHFDLLILEGWVIQTLVLSHIFKAPVIQMSSFGRICYENVGVPSHPLLYPLNVQQRIYNLTLLEKVNVLYTDWKYKNMMNDLQKVNDEWIRKTFGVKTPNLKELKENVQMLFLNMHPLWEENVPVPPAVLYTWSLHHKPEKPLPLDLKTYLENSKYGIIYMSFGTNTDPANLPSETIQMFIRVFSKLPYNILWKWNQDVLPGKSDNIKISKWFPQSDILRHPKTKLFITQGGIQSTDESIVAGVPLIGIPMLGDQWYNVEKYIHHGIGKKLDIETVTEQKLRETIEEVVGNESYRNNIKKLGTQMRDEPAPALQRVVLRVEHMLRHGGASHLRAPTANISWAQYLELELVAILLASCLITASLVIVIFYYSYKRIITIYFLRAHQRQAD